MQPDSESISLAFENSLANFEKSLASIRESEPGWKPDFICICGDIANKALKSEYEQAEDVINRIAAVACLSRDYVMLVPGNHDLVRPPKDEKGGYDSVLGKIAKWLKLVPGNHDLVRPPKDEKGGYDSVLGKITKWLKDKNEKDTNTKAVRPIIGSMFGRYASWRSSLLSDVPGIRYVDLMATVGFPELRGLCGLRIFDSYKVVFAELNSSWCDLGGKNRDVRLGHEIIKEAYQNLEILKRRGFFIIGIFHHSMRFLAVDEYQVRSEFKVYDNIVRVCDLCLSGHEHGSQPKDPDFLGNRCQYILNAGFMSKDEQNNIYESGAMLLRINRYDETVDVRKLMRDTDNTWHEHSEMSTYSLAINRHPVSFGGSHDSTSEKYHYVDSREHRTRIAEVIRIFGSKYSLGADVNSSRDTCELMYDGSKRVGYVAFVSGKNCNSVELEFPAPELKIKLYVIKVDSRYMEENDEDLSALKQKYRDQLLSGKMIVISPS